MSTLLANRRRRGARDRSRRRSPAAATSREVVHPSPSRPRRTSWRARSPPTGRSAEPQPCLRRPGSTAGTAAGSASGWMPPAPPRPPARAPGPLANPAVIESLADGPRLRRHDPGGVRPLLLPLVRRPRARPAAARPGARPAGPGRPDARRARAPLRASARGRPPASPRLARRLDRARTRAGRRDLRRDASSASTRPSGRWRARVERLLAASWPRRPRATPAASSPGCWRRASASGEDSERPALEIDGWRLHGAIDRVDRDADGRALVLDYKLSSRSRRARSSRRRRSCSCSST